MDEYQDILDFWFGALDEDGMSDGAHRQLWFQSDPAFDQELTRLFGADLQKAIKGQYDHWADEPAGRVALLLLLDQFSRNIHRGTAQAFAQDPLAQQLVEEGLSLGQDSTLPAAYRLFFYMPLMHAEDRALQALGVDCFARLAGQVPAAIKPIVDNSRRFAELHQAIVDRFGRFPYRNKALGRPDTAEESAWLVENPGGFGQA
ncbi:DUF924 domain-containing protein [Gallaecimonas kandeliae]|uniref:DUF924 family protein n=1 Tax=Gallaecimonas kandeliae TaxID=3029055 RepID=UPI002647D3CC|nr:DUF924 family protein [Gallaecimonas kandeliae]WKE65147.1 DUF924 domain-containing protein [Gallaecimonas kandeliae]